VYFVYDFNNNNLQGGPKSEATISLPRFSQILTDFYICLTGRFLGKIAEEWFIKNPPLLALIFHMVI